jgi:alpha/beta hydrolase fold
VRNGQQSALAVDVIDLMDALGIESAIVGGCDWGARSANVVAALWPHRCKAMVSVSGHLIGSQAANTAPLPPPAELSWWYQFYFDTERGGPATTGTDATSPSSSGTPRHRSGTFDDETFERSAASFDNVDHVDIVTHNYRWRLGLTLGESQYDLEKQPQRVRSSRCQPSPSKVTPTVPLTRTRAHTRRSSRGSTRTGPSPAASDTTCPKKCPSGRPSRHGHRQILVLTTSRGDPWPDRVERTCATVVRLTNGASRVPVVTAVREPPG